MSTLQERILTLTPREKEVFANYLNLLEKAYDLVGDEAKHEALKRIEQNRESRKLLSTKNLAIR